MDIDELDAADVSRARQLRKKETTRAAKRNIEKRGPLEAGLSHGRKGQQASAELEEKLESELQRLSLLPRQSAYAKHRLRVVRKAMELLNLKGGSRSEEQASELEGLLRQLQL